MPDLFSIRGITATLGVSRTYCSKTKLQQKLIREALHILGSLGLPLKGATARQLEMMAMCFLAVADVKPGDPWSSAKDIDENRPMSTRAIIAWINENFGEQISSGSYDDIRRKHLNHTVLAGIVARTAPNAARNDPTRGYAMDRACSAIIRAYGRKDWESNVKTFMVGRENLAEMLGQHRDMELMPVLLPGGSKLEFSPGEHNELQKAIIEQFLPRYGYGAKVLYVGDTAYKGLHKDEAGLKEICFFDLAYGELPDVVAYAPEKNWIYLIEAVHSSGPFGPERLIEIKKLLKTCTAEAVYVTAFLTRRKFKDWVGEIAWETEVWIAEEPDHLIHFNGKRFLGPYSSP